jgi:adenine deaminase
MTDQARTAAESWTHVQVALGRLPADLLLSNCRVVNVYSQEIHRADVAIRDGLIVAVRENYRGDALQTIDSSRYFAAPTPMELSGDTPWGVACSTVDQVRRTLRRGETVILRDRGGAGELLRDLCRQGIDTSRLCLGFTAGAIALATAAGFALPRIFEMASLNPATAMHIDHLTGSIAPGRRAEIVLFEDPAAFSPVLVVQNTKVQRAAH